MKSLSILVISVTSLCAQELPARSALDRIRAQAQRESQAMTYAFYLTDIHGPRLTGSPAFEKAGKWAMTAMNAIGLQNVHSEPLTGLGKGWSYRRFSIHLVEPQTATLIGIPYPWSSSTKGRQLGAPIYAPLPPLSDGDAVNAFLAKYKGNLRNTVLLADRPQAIRPETTPAFRRYTDAELTKLAEVRPAAAAPQEKNDPQSGPTPAELSERLDRFLQFLEEEGVIAIATVASGSAGRIVLDGTFGNRMKAHLLGPPAIQLAPESYNRLVRLLEKSEPVQVELELESSFHDTGHFNVVGELPGSAKKNEVVLLGAHLDSWHGGTGATDNAAGVAVLLEAMRILSASGVRMDRTIRVALWGAHEIGAQGSQQYIKKHFATSGAGVATDEAGRLSCYFNLDFGAGKIRGLYTQGDDRWAPIFRTWLTPFREMGAATVSNQTTGGSDHSVFQDAALPAFPFIQDPLAYMTRTHHTNVDGFDYLIEEDLRQSAAIVAAVAYQAAMFDQPLPQGSNAR